MQRLTDTVGGWFRRRRPESPTADRGHEHEPVEVNVETSDTDAGESRRGLISMLPGARRDAAIAELQRGYGEVLELMQAVRTHLQQQADRSERLLKIMERVPEGLAALPQQTANQAALIEAISTNLEQQQRQGTKLQDALNNVARSSEHQGQVLGLIQDKLETGRAVDDQTVRSLDAMNETLAQLSQTNHASAQTLRSVTEQAERSTSQVVTMVQRSHRQFTTLLVASWVIAAAALGTAVYAVVQL